MPSEDKQKTLHGVKPGADGLAGTTCEGGENPKTLHGVKPDADGLAGTTTIETNKNDLLKMTSETESGESTPLVAKTGVLSVVATPIGNLEDITLRAIRLLKEADVVVAEDTRHTLHLLHHLGIVKPLISCHDQNEKERTVALLQQLQAGKNLVLVSDAGTPGISDPGEILIREAIAAGYPVTMAPGPAAAVMALVLSGLPAGRFCFEGFLSAQRKDRLKRITSMKDETRTMVFYESPHRIKATLADILVVFGDRKCCIGREMTKKYEEFIRGSVSTIITHYNEVETRGEYVLVVEGADENTLERKEQEAWSQYTVDEHIHLYEDEGLSVMDAMKRVARDRGVGKREIYAQRQQSSEDE